MAIITTYNTLVQAIVDMVEDDSTELANFLPTAIALAEDLLFKEIDLPDLEIKSTGSLVIGSSTLTKPTGYEFANYITITVGSNKYFLKKRLEDYLTNYWPNESTTGVPKYYADSSSTQFKLAPTPDATYAYEIKYTSKPTKLSTSNQTNYFVTSCADMLYFATLVEVALFMKAFDQARVWSEAYSSLKEAWNTSGVRTRRDNGSVPRNPDGGPNSLKHTNNTNT